MSRHVIELTAARVAVAPEDALKTLADQCKDLGVQSFDVYGDATLSAENSWLRRFEKEVADLLQVEDAVFLCSGIMAQSVALRIYKDETTINTFACHYSSHILLHEQNGYSALLDMEPLIIARIDGRQSQLPISYECINSILADGSTTPTPACLVIECPHREIGGKCTPWNDLVKISELCRRRGVKLHMDGARLWEATAGYGRSAAEICSLFDSVYVSFYKGLGGITGAMLLGRKPFIEKSRVWIRRFGGNVYSQLPYAVSCWAGLRANIGDFGRRAQRMKEVVSALTPLFQSETGTRLVRFDPEIPEVSLVHCYISCPVELGLEVRLVSAQECGVSCFSRLRPSSVSTGESYFEFNIVSIAFII
jgi:threonine aldolase